MNADFINSFADFLEERLGKALFNLREKNENYRRLSDEYAALLNGHYNNADEYRHAVSQITDIVKKTTDIEKRYLFLAGMREHANIEDAVSTESFEKLFAELE